MKKIIGATLALISIIFLLFSFFTYRSLVNLKNDSQKLIANSFSGQEEENLNLKIITELEKIKNKLKKISFLDKEKFEYVETANKLAQEFLKNDVNYLIILQNTDELRATGGFMGSYSHYSIKNGLIEKLKIEDIYTPSGQYQSYKEAPPGLNEYLSAGEGMKLPDANWYPDLPKSAENILEFFEEIEKKQYDGVIFANLNLIEKILVETGEIYLPDYNSHINSENFSALAREGRENFFPGSQEKSNFLNASLTAIQIELEKLIKENPQKIISIIQNAISTKDIQAYSKDPEIQNIFEKYSVAGRLINSGSNRYYYLVESNVGINKANKAVSRKIEIEINPVDYQQKSKIKIIYQNQNNKNQEFTDNPFLDEAKHMSYINYQRFFTNPENEVLEIRINDKKLNPEEYQLRLTTNQNGDSFREISTLVTVPEEEIVTVEIDLLETEKFKNNKVISLQKQSGIKSIPTEINFLGEIEKIELKTDQLITF